MVQADVYNHLPTSNELPDSDDTPVDNEDQNLLPNYLLFLLQRIWAERQDWYFGVDMGIYHTTGDNPRVPVVPDSFLSLGVPRRRPDQRSRRSYVTWEENWIVPTLVLEMVSWTPGGEYDKKFSIYETLGVPYYVIYNPDYWQRDRHQPFEVYKRINERYILQPEEPYWVPEMGLAIGRSQGQIGGFERELLTWFDAQGDRYLSTEEQAQSLEAEMLRIQGQVTQAQTQVEEERQARLDAIAPLHQMGLTPEQIAIALNLSLTAVEHSLTPTNFTPTDYRSERDIDLSGA